ncbi:NADH-quinone oxidoreductase subunit J [Jannaschia sp. W003]|uniref:NADH-quinone oxidoreductase subunit J n=1 Tax=Jannaschia sp. W003 TaxID=2867012 RepID=UPI0021A56EE1|nr:NADH-quinone oxidoreductase subunit J [Jannaschia sp. W003]UWQ22843.1 NADH-quinone oxidoreductase subunit J [Jannaschia sp. W003]
MTVADFAFYLFAALVILGGLMTVVSRNPVHSVLWLILTFLSTAGLFVLLGAEFVAMLLVIVYVGAVAVLFLFVVMMLDIDFAELKAEMARYVPLAGLIGLVLLMQLTIAYGVWESAEGVVVADGIATLVPLAEQNTAAIGLVLYDDYLLAFQLAGLILLVAMIGAIALTLRHRKDVKRQDILQQIWRDPAKAMRTTDVKPGQGL